MCALDREHERVPDPRVEAGLAKLGLLPVASADPNEGLLYALEQGFVGELRGRDAATLESLLRAQISSMLCSQGSGVRFRICLVPMGLEVQVRKQA